MTTGIILPFVLAGLLAVVHVLAGRFRVLDTIPRSRWLSAGGGASVAYVFVHILPELHELGEHLDDVPVLAFTERHVYLVGLIGFGAFYGLERLVQRSSHRGGDGDGAPPGIFWIHVGSFGVYNVLIGYLLVHRDTPGTVSLLLFAGAMGLHFVVNDYGLHEHHRVRYDRRGRWLLAGGVLIGVAVGALTEIDEAKIAVLFGFLAGGIVLNVIKEELPEERESRFPAFALGATAYTALLLSI